MIYQRLKWTFIRQRGHESYEISQGDNFGHSPIKEEDKSILPGVLPKCPWMTTYAHIEKEEIQEHLTQLEFDWDVKQIVSSLFYNYGRNTIDVYRQSNRYEERPWLFGLRDSEERPISIEPLINDIKARWGGGILFIHEHKEDELETKEKL